LSLMPLEVMAAGCAVVSNRGECVEWLLHDDVALLTDPTLEALSDALCRLLQNDAERQALASRGQEFARQQHWQASAEAFEQGLLAARKAIPASKEGMAP
jgi:glycosyltransferase involved in cell wall biosynthesis